jgi:hypothetical protein
MLETLIQKSESVSFMKYVPEIDPEVYNMCENLWRVITF